MNGPFFADELGQAFESDGNVVLIFTAPSGEVRPDGSDIRQSSVAVVAPASRLAAMARDLAAAAESFGAQTAPPDAAPDEDREILGQPLPLK